MTLSKPVYKVEYLPELFQIIADATYLTERLENFDDFVFLEDEKVIEENLLLWKESLGADEEKFERRLNWEGWDRKRVQKVLGPCRLKSEVPLPKWAAILNQIIVSVGAYIPKTYDNQLPFEEILIYFAEVAKNHVLHLVSKPFYKDLEKELLSQLGFMCESALEKEFDKVRPESCKLMGFVFEESGDRFYYDQWIHNILQPDQWLAFFKTYPVLGRIVATAIEFWIESSEEFCQRLENDRAVLEKEFHIYGDLISLDCGLSDPHNRGRDVKILKFENGQKIVYKPKDLTTEKNFYHLLEWCNENGSPRSFKIIKILARDHYGWEEFVEQKPLVDAAAFYERAGMLLCVLYLLKGSDCHYENVIAHEEHLVLVDAEILLSSIDPPSKEDLSLFTVALTGLLPSWSGTDPDHVVDLCGFGCPVKKQGKMLVTRWLSLNTDHMHRKEVSIEAPSVFGKNLSQQQGQILEAYRYVEEICLGFQKMYLFFISRKGLISNILKIFRDSHVRMIFLETKTYWKILKKSYLFESLKSGLCRSFVLDCICKTFLNEKENTPHFSVTIKEIKALEELAIPLLTVSPCLDLLDQFKPEDLENQLNLIRLSFYSQNASFQFQERSLEKNPSSLTPNECVQIAEKIAYHIKKSAIKDEFGNLGWLALNSDAITGRLKIEPLKENLYEGNCGVALFLSALYHFTGESSLKSLALESLKIVRSKIKNQTLKKNIGGFNGLGSIIYSMLHFGTFLEEEELTQEAVKVGEMIEDSLIFADRKLDLMDGSAGCLLGLLALYSKTKQALFLEKAICCGRNLLAHSISKGGFAHGSAGYSYALLRLFEVTQEKSFLDGAKGSYISTFSQTNWCNGWSGLTLARLGTLHLFDNEEIRNEISHGLKVARNYFSNVNSVCCGNFGHVETLLVAYQITNEESYLKEAFQMTSNVLRDKNLQPEPPFFTPGFHQGLSGIGYQLLRLSDPQKLPSVLLLAHKEGAKATTTSSRSTTTTSGNMT